MLMPIVASMGGNAGTQILTVSVRALAMRQHKRSNATRILWKEVAVGGIIGFLFAEIAGVLTGAWFRDSILDWVIASAMISTW